jgi:hypothetical protein
VRIIPWALTVAGTVWTTGNAAVAAAAIAAFQWQRANAAEISREGLGGALGAGFGLWSGLVQLPLLVIMVSLGWLAGSAWRLGQRARAAWLVAAMAILWGVHSVNHQTVAEANQAAADIRALRTSEAGNAAVRRNELEQRFAVLHQASERWHGIETVLALTVLISGSVALLRRPTLTSPSPSAAPSAAPAAL